MMPVYGASRLPQRWIDTCPHQWIVQVIYEGKASPLGQMSSLLDLRRARLEVGLTCTWCGQGQRRFLEDHEEIVFANHEYPRVRRKGESCQD